MSEPLYLIQGSLIFTFISQEKGEIAHQEALQAFKSTGEFRGFLIATEINPLPVGLSGQPNEPWWIPQHNCVVVGLRGFLESFSSDPKKSPILVSFWPPIEVGNRVRCFGLQGLRASALRIEREKTYVLKTSASAA